MVWRARRRSTLPRRQYLTSRFRINSPRFRRIRYRRRRLDTRAHGHLLPRPRPFRREPFRRRRGGPGRQARLLGDNSLVTVGAAMEEITGGEGVGDGELRDGRQCMMRVIMSNVYTTFRCTDDVETSTNFNLVAHVNTPQQVIKSCCIKTRGNQVKSIQQQ